MPEALTSWRELRGTLDPDVPCDGCGRCDCFPCMCGASGHDTCVCDVDELGRFVCVGLDYGHTDGLTVLCHPCYRHALEEGE